MDWHTHFGSSLNVSLVIVADGQRSGWKAMVKVARQSRYSEAHRRGGHQDHPLEAHLSEDATGQSGGHGGA